ncbi:CoA ester lyase [Sporichthya sp.]|uniref:HpcH/HpaI aldolase/citrate lyase family protein n=1 Tax=Sporichthya sp. TaxID=65475 RepID=UPI0017C2F435|nr:CoA ester lyase [Sporichthya sp.]MBA3741965.1 CoA ester lyase [Sporichthya sp.]
MITPIFDDHKLDKATRCPADVIILDLEDGVHESRKVEARQRIVDLLGGMDWRGKDVVVRVNPMSGSYAEEDILAVAPALPDALLLAKLDSVDEVLRADALIGSVAPAGVRMWGLIESAVGIVNIEAIAFASPRLEALVLGPGDLAADLKLNTRRYTMAGADGQREEILYFQSRLVAACRAAGLSPITGIPTVTRDDEAAFSEATYLFKLGFDTVAAFTPRTIEQVHRAYLPTSADETWAREVLRVEAEKAEKAVSFGVLDGAMVDGPFYRGARNLLQRLEDAERTDKLDAAERDRSGVRS